MVSFIFFLFQNLFEVFCGIFHCFVYQHDVKDWVPFMTGRKGEEPSLGCLQLQNFKHKMRFEMTSVED